MKFVFSALLLAVILSAEEQPDKPQTLKEVLLEQLHTTHDKADWFVPLHVAIAGLKPAQVTMTDNHGNHSIGQLAYSCSSGIRVRFRSSTARSLRSSAGTTMRRSTNLTASNGPRQSRNWMPS